MLEEARPGSEPDSNAGVKKFAAVCTIIVLIACGIAAATVITRGPIIIEQVAGKPQFIGYPVYLLGRSSNTGLITERLNESTHDIRILSDISETSIIGPHDILILDGEWAATFSIMELGSTIAPLILQGTPILLLNQTSEVFNWVAENAPASLPSWSVSSTDSHGTPTPTIFNGLALNPIDQTTAAISLGSGGTRSSFEDAITELYEWGVGKSHLTY